MYGKIFDSMYDSTLADDWRALITFQQMIVMCDADGVVDMTPQAISRRTSIPIEHIKAGIEILESTDPYSRTPDNEGRRIERIDEHRPWGWVIVNHSKYKALVDSDTVRAQTRERVRKHREKKKCNGKSVTVTQCNGPKRHTDTDTDTIKEGRFTPPTLTQVREYLLSRGITDFTAERFFNHYESTNWYRGKTKIKRWKSCVATWVTYGPKKESEYGAGAI
jgi:hypothetical protein